MATYWLAGKWMHPKWEARLREMKREGDTCQSRARRKQEKEASGNNQEERCND
jgi:hypothetical protein